MGILSVSVYIQMIDIQIVAIYNLKSPRHENHPPLAEGTMRLRASFSMLILTVAAGFFALGKPVAAQKKSKEPIKVYVFANSGGFADDRSDSARDIRRALYVRNRILMVGPDESPDITIEVLNRAKTDSGGYSAATLSVRMIAGSYTTDIEESDSGPTLGIWSSVAIDVAEKVTKWINANHDRLVAMRSR